jgi:hypothetical protein
MTPRKYDKYIQQVYVLIVFSTFLHICLVLIAEKKNSIFYYAIDFFIDNKHLSLRLLGGGGRGHGPSGPPNSASEYIYDENMITITILSVFDGSTRTRTVYTDPILAKTKRWNSEKLCKLVHVDKIVIGYILFRSTI